MVRNGEITVTDARRVLRRYWWILPITIFVCGTLGLLLAMAIPKRYTSHTMVLVDLPTVPTDLVRPAISEDVNHQLSSIKEEILSRTRLEDVIEKFGLYAKDRGRVPLEELASMLKSAVSVKPMESMPGTQTQMQNYSLPGFSVDVTFDGPQIAQQICTEITTVFISHRNHERINDSKSVTLFLSGQVDEAKAKLDGQEARLTEFKRQHLGLLPEEEQVSLNVLTAMNAQLQANLQELNHARQDKALNEALLSQQKANSEITAEQQLNLLEAQLTGLLSKYTPEHPDVVKLQSQIKELKKRMAEDPRTTAGERDGAQASGGESPQVQQLMVKLRQDELNVADLTRRQNQLQEQIHELQGRLQASPVVAQQFKELTASHQAALDFYNDLLKRQRESSMVADLEHRQESEQFRILDAPSLPDKPSFPRKSYFAGGGLGAGVLLGFGIMYLIALDDKSMHTERDVEICLNLPVLAVVPALKMGRSSLGKPRAKAS